MMQAKGDHFCWYVKPRCTAGSSESAQQQLSSHSLAGTPYESVLLALLEGLRWASQCRHCVAVPLFTVSVQADCIMAALQIS